MKIQCTPSYRLLDRSASFLPWQLTPQGLALLPPRSLVHAAAPPPSPPFGGAGRKRLTRASTLSHAAVAFGADAHILLPSTRQSTEHDECAVLVVRMEANYRNTSAVARTRHAVALVQRVALSRGGKFCSLTQLGQGTSLLPLHGCPCHAVLPVRNRTAERSSTFTPSAPLLSLMALRHQALSFLTWPHEQASSSSSHLGLEIFRRRPPSGHAALSPLPWRLEPSWVDLA